MPEPCRRAATDATPGTAGRSCVGIEGSRHAGRKPRERVRSARRTSEARAAGGTGGQGERTRSRSAAPRSSTDTSHVARGSAPSERPVGSRSASSDHTDRRGEPPAEHEDLGRSRRGRWPPGGGLGGRRGLGGSDRADPTARYRDPDEPHPGRGRGVGRDTRACRRQCNPDDREVRARPYRSDLSKSAPCFCRGGHRSPRTLVVADRRSSADRRGSRARKGRLTPSVEW